MDLFQRCRGRRPREALGLRAVAGFLLSRYGVSDPAAPVVLHLGARTGTKCKRPKADVIAVSDGLAQDLVRWLTGGVEAGGRLAGAYQYSHYRTAYVRFCEAMRLLPYRPHSPRAGRASEDFLAGKPATEIQAQLRHSDLRSLKTYLDVVALLRNHTDGDARRWAAASGLVRKHLWSLLSGDLAPWEAIDQASPVVIPGAASRAPRSIARPRAAAPPRGAAATGFAPG